MKTVSVFDAGSPEYYGFGVGIMKQIKVCFCCGASESSERYICGQCGARLPAKTLFQQYQQMHRRCSRCDTVLAEGMRFCPHCGLELMQKKRAEDD